MSTLRRLKREIDEFFECIARGFDMEQLFVRRYGSFSPNVDMNENDKEITISAEITGMVYQEKDDIRDISVLHIYRYIYI